MNTLNYLHLDEKRVADVIQAHPFFGHNFCD